MKTCPLTPYIQKNVRSQIQRLKKDGITGMGMKNLFQVTPTPPQHLAGSYMNANIINYRPTFERVAAEVAAELKFPILTE
jgi:hypothetical protein